MRRRVSMRFTRLKHVDIEEPAKPALKISNPTLKHSSISFEESSTTGASTSKKGSIDLHMPYDMDTNSPRTIEKPPEDKELLTLPEVDSGFADMLQFVDYGDQPPELLESPVSKSKYIQERGEASRDSARGSPASLRAVPRRPASNTKELPPTPAHVSLDKDWSDITVGMNLHSFQEQNMLDGAPPKRTSSRRFSFVSRDQTTWDDPLDPSTVPNMASPTDNYGEIELGLGPRTTSRNHIELSQLALLRQELKDAQAQLEAERREKELLKTKLARKNPQKPATAMPPTSSSSTIEEYKLAIARLNEIRALQIQERDTRIALLEETLLRQQQQYYQRQSGSSPALSVASDDGGAMGYTNGRIQRMRLLLPVGSPVVTPTL